MAEVDLEPRWKAAAAEIAPELEGSEDLRNLPDKGRKLLNEKRVRVGKSRKREELLPDQIVEGVEDAKVVADSAGGMALLTPSLESVGHGLMTPT